MGSAPVRSRFFAGLSPAAASAVGERLRFTMLEQGDVLFHEGERGRSLFLVCDGEVVALQTGDGAAITLQRYHPGDFFGVASLIEAALRPWTVVAGTPVRLAELTDSEFAAVYRDDPGSYVQLLHNVIRELLRALQGAAEGAAAAQEVTQADTTQLRLDRS